MHKIVFTKAATSPNIVIKSPSNMKKIENTPWYIDIEGPNNLVKNIQMFF